MKSFILLVALVLSITQSQIANAVPAGDVLNRMETKERSHFLVGLMTMHSYHAVLNNDLAQGKCIARASNKEETLATILAAFERWPDKPAEGLVILVLNKACPK